MTVSRNAWMKVPQVSSPAKLRLFCFPYAGGGASLYHEWSRRMSPAIEVYPVQLPGRENRMLEEPFSNLHLLVDTVAPMLLPYLDKPFAFFGHSMGALISFELARWLRANTSLSPLVLLVSSHRAPQLAMEHEPIHELPEPAFIEELHKLESIPGDILQNDEIMELVLPTLRSDFAMCETYQYVAAEPLACPISAFGGSDDHVVSHPDLEAWRAQTTGPFTLRFIEGGHLFVRENSSSILEAVQADLQARLPL